MSHLDETIDFQVAASSNQEDVEDRRGFQRWGSGMLKKEWSCTANRPYALLADDQQWLVNGTSRIFRPNFEDPFVLLNDRQRPVNCDGADPSVTPADSGLVRGEAAARQPVSPLNTFICHPWDPGSRDWLRTEDEPDCMFCSRIEIFTSQLIISL